MCRKVILLQTAHHIGMPKCYSVGVFLDLASQVVPHAFS